MDGSFSFRFGKRKDSWKTRRKKYHLEVEGQDDRKNIRDVITKRYPHVSCESPTIQETEWLADYGISHLLPLISF